MCLVILLGAVAVGVLLAILLAITVQDCADYASNYRSQRTCTLGGKPKFIAVVVLSLLLAVVEFFLFVAGCIDTHRRNRIPPAVRQVPIHQAGENGQGVNMPDTALPQKQSWKITKDVAHVVVIIISIIGAGMAFSRINPSLDYTRYYDGTGESEAFGSIVCSYQPRFNHQNTHYHSQLIMLTIAVVHHRSCLEHCRTHHPFLP